MQEEDTMEDSNARVDVAAIETDPLTGEVIVRNALTGQAYRGGNVARLLGSCIENGFDPAGRWAGFKQWLELGRVVRKGQHGTPCMTIITVDVANDRGSRSRPRGFRVFHIEQTEVLS